MNHANFFPFERNRYFYGKLLTVRDFEVEQRYHCSKRALLNRLLHGSGVVCGLGVTASDESTLMIESGMALDYQGREIVLPETLFRKLQMLEGQETLAGKKDAYLCLSYAQEDVEPVNATGAEVGSQRQFDLTREGYRLFLTTEPPAYQELLEAAGEENVSVLYQSDDLILVLSVPSGLYAGEEFQVRVLVVKNEKTPPVQFSLEGENTFVESDNGRVRLAYRESREEKRCVYTVDFPLRARALSDVDGQLFPSGCELNVELGSHRYKNYLTVEAAVHLCRDQEESRLRRRRMDDLSRHLRGRDLPLYGGGDQPALPADRLGRGGAQVGEKRGPDGDHLGAQPGVLAETRREGGVPALHRRAPSGLRHPLAGAVRLRRGPRHRGPDHARGHPGEQPGVLQGDRPRPGGRGGGRAPERGV